MINNNTQEIINFVLKQTYGKTDILVLNCNTLSSGKKFSKLLYLFILFINKVNEGKCPLFICS